MARYIDADEALRMMQHSKEDKPSYADWDMAHDCCIDCVNTVPTADVVEVKHGEWTLEVHSFYADNWDESIELCVYILASCSNCGEEHKPKQVFSKHLYAPEDADDDFRFDQECEKSKALEEFKQQGYKFKNYCPNCGAKMDGKDGTK